MSEQEHWNRDKFDAKLKKVDQEAIGKFWAGDTWQEKVGAVGSTIKQYFESHFGTKYPEFKGIGSSNHPTELPTEEWHVQQRNESENSNVVQTTSHQRRKQRKYASN